MVYMSIACLDPETHVREIRLNCPERLNAIDEEVAIELNQAFGEIARDEDIRVVILSGEGRAFCAGANYKRHAQNERTMYQRREYVRILLDTCRNLYRFPKPIIASVQGYAVGIGAEMCLNCDFIVMSDTAELGFPEIGIATMVGGGVTMLLPRLVGLARAREMLMLGSRITGKYAAEIGLAFRSVPTATLKDETLSLARKLVNQAPVSLSSAKQLLNTDCDYENILTLEREAVLTCMMTEDWQEGVRSFAEKRKPVFRGR